LDMISRNAKSVVKRPRGFKYYIRRHAPFANSVPHNAFFLILNGQKCLLAVFFSQLKFPSWMVFPMPLIIITLAAVAIKGG
jgi:hypothetical protein